MSMEEVVVPQPEPVNYQTQVDVCKSCGIPGSGDKPLLVIRMITPRDEGAFISEHWVHMDCVGVQLVLHTRSLFQIKYNSDGQEVRPV